MSMFENDGSFLVVCRGVHPPHKPMDSKKEKEDDGEVIRGLDEDEEDDDPEKKTSELTIPFHVTPPPVNSDFALTTSLSGSILLQSNEEHDFVQIVLSPEAVRLSTRLIDHAHTNSADVPFHLEYCSRLELSLCVDLLEFARKNAIPSIPAPAPRNWEKQLDKWLRTFLKTLSFSNIRALIKTTNYLNIDPLVYLLCVQVASMLKGRTASQIRTLLEKATCPVEKDL